MKLRLSWILACIFMLVQVDAQEVPSFEKKVYRSEDDKLYVNKELPVYVYISTSPDGNAEKHLLKSEKTSAYSNPMYLDTEGYNSFHSPSAVDTNTKKTVYPLRDIIFEVYSDSRAPKTSIDFGNTTIFTKGGKKYVNGKASIHLRALDQMSGVKDIYYSVDGKPYQIYEDTLSLDQEKEYILKYFAVDHVGNVEEVKEAIFELDNTEPVTQLNLLEDHNEHVISGRSRIELKSKDQGIGVAAIKYSINDGAEKTYTSPIMAQYLPEGEHNITYYAVDKVDNREEQKSYTFYVDKTPPTIIEEIIGTSFMANGKEYTSGRTQLKLVAFDNKAGVKEIYYSINNEDYQLYDKPFYLSMSSGNLEISTYAVDKVNNKSSGREESTRANIPYIDLSGPSLDFGFNGPVFHTSDTIYINQDTRISLKGNDKEAGLSRIQYRIDDKKAKEYTGSFAIEKEGYYNIFYEGFDNVNNSSNNGFEVFVDNTGPEIHPSFGTSSKGKEKVDGKVYEIYPPHVVLFLSATDEKVGLDRIYYTINNGTEKHYAGLISSLSPGKYEIEIRAVDKLGNNNKETIQFAVMQ